MSLFRKVLGSVVELDPETPDAAPVSTAPASPTPTLVTGPTLLVVAPTTTPTPTTATSDEDVQHAQNAVLVAVRYTEKANLVKHTATVSKLLARMPDEAAAIAAAFDTLDVMDIKRETIIAEANACVAAADALVATLDKDTTKTIDDIQARKAAKWSELTSEAKDIQSQIAALQARAASVTTSLSAVDEVFAAEQAKAISKRDLVTAVATSLRAEWQKVLAK